VHKHTYVIKIFFLCNYLKDVISLNPDELKTRPVKTSRFYQMCRNYLKIVLISAFVIRNMNHSNIISLHLTFDDLQRIVIAR